MLVRSSTSRGVVIVCPPCNPIGGVVVLAVDVVSEKPKFRTLPPPTPSNIQVGWKPSTTSVNCTVRFPAPAGGVRQRSRVPWPTRRPFLGNFLLDGRYCYLGRGWCCVDKYWRRQQVESYRGTSWEITHSTSNEARNWIWKVWSAGNWDKEEEIESNSSS